ncbi:YwqG family protein [Jiangella aurantiaca]|uniref:YwqG family protein n=1 Tax=Jiangella aurantiaca TaxID=2530373 RepID=UPI0013A5C2B6|nr:YwqG family protein [Jiangella aurantiaca]
MDQLDSGEVLRQLEGLIAFRAILPAQKWLVLDVVRRERNQARLSEIAYKLQGLAETVGIPSLLAHVEDSDCSLVLVSSDGIVLGLDGTLTATIRLRDAHGVETRVVLRAKAGGGVEVVQPSDKGSAPPSPARSLDETEDRIRLVTALAREHLSAPAAEEFLAMLRPALRLVHAGEDDRVIAQLGGLPTLPINSWPVWDGHGPLSHVLSFDCAPVAELLPELGIPHEGRLTFFYFDGAYDDYRSIVGTWDPSTSPGFHVLHLHPENSRAHITDAATPVRPGLTPFAPVALAAVRTLTWPAHETPMAGALWMKHGLVDVGSARPSEPVRALYDALWKLPGGGYDTHQIGGHPCPQQGPVEMEVEQLRRGLGGEPFAWDDPEVRSAASTWQLLLQVASDDDADMMWGDVGQLYYLASDVERPGEALFTWQCG